MDKLLKKLVAAGEDLPSVDTIIGDLKKKELDDLIRILKHHYYFAVAMVTDRVYDQIEKFARSKGVKISVGASRKELVDLPFYLSSLEKVTTDDEVSKYFAKYDDSCNFVVMEKLNGVSGLYVCEKDKTTKLYTRGDHSRGQDISRLLQYFDLPKVRGLAVRGEIILASEGWSEVHQQYPEFKNALGAVVGVVNCKTIGDSELFRLARLKFVVYEVVNYKSRQMKISQQLSRLEKWGFTTVHHQTLGETPTPELLSATFSTRREQSDFDIDGLVITANIKYDRCHGENPTYSIAYKKLLETRVTTVTKIEWKASKSGKLCPVAHYKAVDLGGSTLTKTTVHNAKMVEQMGLGEGAVVEVELRVVPKILRVLEKVDVQMPDCDYRWDDNHVHIYTAEDEDPTEMQVNKIYNFVKKLGIKNFARGMIAKCVENGMDTVMKVVEASIDDFLQIPTFKELTAHKVHSNIHTALRHATLAQVMAGSNCFGDSLGVRKLQPVIAKFPDLIEKEVTEEQLLTVQGCKAKTIKKILKGLTKFRKLWKHLSKYYTYAVEEAVSSEKEYDGKTFVFSEFRDKELEQRIIRGGGKVTSAVSSKTTALVVKSLQSETTKVQKAKKLGVPIMLHSEFE